LRRIRGSGGYGDLEGDRENGVRLQSEAGAHLIATRIFKPRAALNIDTSKAGGQGWSNLDSSDAMLRGNMRFHPTLRYFLALHKYQGYLPFLGNLVKTAWSLIKKLLTKIDGKQRQVTCSQALASHVLL
jgi:hypothetical protein